MTRTRRFLAILAAAFVLVAPACSTNDDDDADVADTDDPIIGDDGGGDANEGEVIDDPATNNQGADESGAFRLDLADGPDPDGTGTANLRLDADQGEVCYELNVTGIGAITGLHIHEGAAGEDGPVVVPFPPPIENGGEEACVDVDQETVTRILGAPGEFYLNVHTEEFPNGAIRGQLA